MRKSPILFDGDTFTHNGREYRFSTSWDDAMSEPWKEHDGHGVVSDWTTRDKLPGERVLNTDRSSKRYYDIAETIRLAKRDGWGLGPDDESKLAQAFGRAPTKGEIIAQAVENDFDYLRRWCNDQWNWIVIKVEHEESGEVEYLGGIESDDYDGMEMAAHELADEISFRLDSELADAITESRPDMAPTY